MVRWASGSHVRQQQQEWNGDRYAVSLFRAFAGVSPLSQHLRDPATSCLCKSFRLCRRWRSPLSCPRVPQ